MTGKLNSSLVTDDKDILHMEDRKKFVTFPTLTSKRKLLLGGALFVKKALQLKFIITNMCHVIC